MATTVYASLAALDANDPPQNDVVRAKARRMIAALGASEASIAITTDVTGVLSISVTPTPATP